MQRFITTRRIKLYFLQGGVALGRVVPMFDAGKGKADTDYNRLLIRKRPVQIWVKGWKIM